MSCISPEAVSAVWALDVVRDLRVGESTQHSMNLAADLAPRATGCAGAEIVETKPKVKSAFPGAPAVTPVVQLGTDCLAAESLVSAAGPEADSEWGAILAAGEPATVELSDDSVLLGCFLPNGGGRRPAALVLNFNGKLAPEPDTLERVRAYAELADTTIGYSYATEQVASLRAALETNREIGTAMGILMATRKVSDDEAFGLLRSESQRSRRKLGAVAAEVVYAGTLPL